MGEEGGKQRNKGRSAAGGRGKPPPKAPGRSRAKMPPAHDATSGKSRRRSGGDKREDEKKPSSSFQRLLRVLAETRLLPADEIEALRDSPPADNSAKSAVQELARQGKLTPYQARAVLEGKAYGLVFGDYVVLDTIGAGGMGQVFKALHTRMKRTVAIKLLPTSATSSAEAIARFHREVEVAARLVHPNVVTAYDAGEARGRSYLVMQYVDGPDLASHVARDGPLAVADAIDYCRQAARALQYAHEQGVVHRDVKPGNLLLDGQGTVKLLDLGLARSEGGSAEMDASEPGGGHVMGSVAFMAPEQARDFPRADHRVDVYSLGCTLHYLLTGAPPYEADSPAATVAAHRGAPVPSLRQARSEVPAKLDDAFARMVAKRPERRFPSMDQVVAELEECLASFKDGAAGAEVRQRRQVRAARTAPPEPPAPPESPAVAAAGPPPLPAEQTTAPTSAATSNTIPIPTPSTTSVAGSFRRARRRGSQRTWIAILVLAASIVVLGVTLLVAINLGNDSGDDGGPGANGAGTRLPASSPKPLARPPSKPAGEGGDGQATPPDEPERFDPSTP